MKKENNNRQNQLVGQKYTLVIMQKNSRVNVLCVYFPELQALFNAITEEQIYPDELRDTTPRGVLSGGTVTGLPFSRLTLAAV